MSTLAIVIIIVAAIVLALIAFFALRGKSTEKRRAGRMSDSVNARGCEAAPITDPAGGESERGRGCLRREPRLLRSRPVRPDMVRQT